MLKYSNGCSNCNTIKCVTHTIYKNETKNQNNVKMLHKPNVFKINNEIQSHKN